MLAAPEKAMMHAMSAMTPTSKLPVVNWLGYGGLIPFLALTALVCADRERSAHWHAELRDYGAVILSFVGALHWGFATAVRNLTDPQRHGVFLWSVMPCLIAFFALIVDPFIGDVMLVGGFVLHYVRDRQLSPIVPLPAWYLPLRLRLTLVASVCIAIAAVATR